jgi:hypothetical protein
MDENKDIINEQGAEKDEQGKTPTVEELMTQLAQERAQNVKLKNSLDSAASEAAGYKKQLRARQTAEEQEAEAKKEAEEKHKAYVAGLEAELGTMKATKRYMGLGMSEDLATETAKAEIAGDVETVTANMKKYMDMSIKAKEAEWLKSRPDANAGHGEDGEEKDPFLAGWDDI